MTCQSASSRRDRELIAGFNDVPFTSCSRMRTMNGRQRDTADAQDNHDHTAMSPAPLNATPDLSDNVAGRKRDGGRADDLPPG
jgi:hypothetical protein